jgi:hypothetical protein
MTDDDSLSEDQNPSSDDRTRGPEATTQQAKTQQTKAPQAETPRVSLDSAEAILAAVPHLLGFYPSHSLVVLGLESKRGRVHVTFRYDLPEPPDSALVPDIADHAVSVLQQQRLRLAVLIAYGPAALVTPVLAPTMKWLGANGITLREVLRAEGGRYWSVLCTDPHCCPPEGVPFDPCSHPTAAAMARAGLEALPDRAALARTLQPPAGSAESIRQSTQRAEQRLCDLGVERWAQEGIEGQQVTAEIGRAELQRAIRCYREGGSITTRDELAWLALLLTDLRVRDDSWARMDPAHVDDHIRLWTDVVRGAATEYAPAPASLLAFVAWQAGRGALATVAVDRALAARPGYSMALLIGDALHAGLPPSAAKLPMTPEQVAKSYADQAGKARSRARTKGQPDSARSRSRRARSGSATSGSTTSGSTTSGASKRPSG